MSLLPYRIIKCKIPPYLGLSRVEVNIILMTQPWSWVQSCIGLNLKAQNDIPEVFT